jgi:hypothetical protein
MTLPLLCLGWVVCAVVVTLVYWKRNSSGLVLAYLLNISLTHWLGAAAFILPWNLIPTLTYVEAGFAMSTLGVAAFSAGALFVAPFIQRRLRRTPEQTVPPSRAIATTYVVLGIVAYFLLGTALSRVPSVTSLLATGWGLINIGLALHLWSAWVGRERWRFVTLLLAVSLLPLMTLVTHGFVGYGAVAVLTVLAFVAGYYQPRWRVVAAGVLLVYLALSVFVTYMRDRTAIRDVVWGGEAFQNRMAVIYATFTDFELFSPWNPEHLWRIDRRLNQNYLVGVAIHSINGGDVPYARGATIWSAATGFVPRIFWPEKPVQAGSGSIVSDYTGLRFGPGTSVGVGQVMESYINFGAAGVFVGLLLIGSLVGTIDIRAGEYVKRGNWFGFTIWFLPGMALLQVGGSFVDVTTGLAASLVIARLANYVAAWRAARHSSPPDFRSLQHPIVIPNEP